MARIIGEAGIRLVADDKGLAAEMRSRIQKAVDEATRTVRASNLKGLEDDADKSSDHIRGVLTKLQDGVGKVGSTLASSLTSAGKLTLIGAAAGVGLAGVSSLVTGLVGLVGVLGQAAGVAALLPAAFLGIKAVTATLKIGLQGVGDSISALASGDMAAFNESLKNLSPNARAVIGQLRVFKDDIKNLKMQVQDDLFAGLREDLSTLVGQTFPLASKLLRGIAQDLNSAAKESITFLSSGPAQGQIADLFDNIRTSVSNLVPAFKPLISAFLNIAQVGSNFLPQITQGIAGLATKFGEFIQGAADSGALTTFFQNAIDTVKKLGQVLVQFGGGLAAVFKAANSAGGGLLNSLLDIGKAFNKFTSSAQGQTALISFFKSMHDIIQSVLPVFKEIATVVGNDVAPILADLARTIGPALTPIVKGIGEAFKAAGPGISALAQGFARFLEAAAPLLPILGQIAGIIAGVFGKVFQALAPVLVKVADAIQQGLNQALPILEPVLAQVAAQVGDLFTALVPLIPIFFQLLSAVLPLVPPLLQIAIDAIPALISIINALLPVINVLVQYLGFMITAAGAVSSFISTVFVPVINSIITVVTTVATAVFNAFSSMFNFIVSILSAIGSAVSTAFNAVVNAISTAISRAVEGVKTGFSAAYNAVATAMQNVGRAVSEGIGNVVSFFSQLAGKVTGALISLPGQLFDIGVNIVKGLIDGIKAWVSRAIQAVIDFGKSIINGITGALGISSPSKEFRKVGEFSGQGFVIGLESMIPDAVAAATSLADAALAAGGGALAAPDLAGMRGAGSRAASGGSSMVSTTTLYQTNVMQPGTDMVQFAREVQRNGAQQLNAGSSSVPVSLGSIQSGMAAPGTLYGVALGV